MSRSIHVTRHRLQELERAAVSRRDEQQRHIDHARRMLFRKRAIKIQILRRREQCRLPEVPVDVDSIPIAVRDQQEFVQYPASVEDVRAILRLLPPGTVDELSRVVLCLGAEHQQDSVQPGGAYGEPDPLLGRLGSEALPGVYSGEYLGSYYWRDASIWLYAYVYDASILPDRELRELYLRLQMLETLVHEVAHH